MLYMILPSIFDQMLLGMALRSRFRCRAFGVVPNSSAIRFSVTLSWPDPSPNFSAVAMVMLPADVRLYLLNPKAHG